jgi:hypothetical protein
MLLRPPNRREDALVQQENQSFPVGPILAVTKGISQVVRHERPVGDAVFDEANLRSAAGLVPVAALAREAGLRKPVDEHLSVPSDKGANAGLKV